MSDPDARPDPIDKAYVEAEAVLSDEAARTTRRARVLAAVARQDAPDAAAPAGRPVWRRGGWLVAACVSGLAVVIASQLYQPPPRPPPSKPTAAAPAPVAVTSRISAAPASPAPAKLPAPKTEAAPRAVRSEVEPPRVVAPTPAPPPAAPPETAPTPRAPPSDDFVPPPPSPPRADIAAAGRAAPVPPANQPQSPNGGAENGAGVSELVVTGARRESRQQSLPVAISAFTSSEREIADPGARLRAAAAAGRATEMEALLEHGAGVDAADADGDTALMKSIQADRPAIAALLRRHGASLDQKNHAGETARDMARAKGDAELNQAIGLPP